MCAVKLKEKSNPFVNIALLLGTTLLTAAILYYGIPNTDFRGVRAGVFFPHTVELPEDVRFMDNRIKCEAPEALVLLRAAVVKIKPDYPVESLTLRFQNYSSGYKYNISYASYYAQRINFAGDGGYFRKGAIVGDPVLDAEVKAKDDELEKAIRDTLEAYFKAKGAQ